VDTVPPNFTARLVATGNAANRPSALIPPWRDRSLAASTFTILAEIKPALKADNLDNSFQQSGVCVKAIERGRQLFFHYDFLICAAVCRFYHDFSVSCRTANNITDNKSEIRTRRGKVVRIIPAGARWAFRGDRVSTQK
jgi:hypothetical protein